MVAELEAEFPRGRALPNGVSSKDYEDTWPKSIILAHWDENERNWVFRVGESELTDTELHYLGWPVKMVGLKSVA